MSLQVCALYTQTLKVILHSKEKTMVLVLHASKGSKKVICYRNPNKELPPLKINLIVRSWFVIKSM